MKDRAREDPDRIGQYTQDRVGAAHAGKEKTGKGQDRKPRT